MTDEEYDILLASQEDHLRKRLTPWIEKASGLVRSKIEDSSAHALKAITESLKKTPDGRETDRKVSKSPSFIAALARLDELATLLAGSSSSSLDGLIRDARESFYRDSFEVWKAMIPAESWISTDPRPTQIGMARVRAMQIHGADVRVGIASSITQAKEDLKRAVNLGASRDSSHEIAADRLKTWARLKTDLITRTASLELSDSGVLVHGVAATDLVHPDYR